jgi:small ligand-binding sensory domain FIST
MHGCSPLDGVYHTITKIEGPIIRELNGRPIVEILDELFGNREWRGQTPVNYLTLGVNYGERYGEPKESDYVNRLMIGVLPDGSGVTLFEPDFAEGLEVQFMLRDTRKMVESARDNALALFEEITKAGKRPVFALYIDCAGRTMGYSSSTVEESAEVQRTCNHYGVPLLGLFTGVEIAPLLGRLRGLDWTGVLAVVAEDT